MLAVARDQRGHRFTPFYEALAQMTVPVTAAPSGAGGAAVRKDEPDWPFRGPSAALEVMEAIRGSGGDLATYHGA